MKNPLLTIALAGLITFIFGGDYANASTAFSLSGIIKQAEVIKVNAVTAVTNSAITVSTTIRGFAANDPYQIKKLDVSKATYMTRFKAGMGEGGGLKGLLKRNAWYIGWAATMAAAGWAIDELTNQMTRKVVISGTCGYIPGGSVNGLSQQGCLDMVNADWSAWNITNMSPPVLTQTSTTKTYTYTFIAFPKSCGSPPCDTPSNQRNVKFFYSHPNNAPSTAQLVPDDALYDSLITEMLKDPNKASQAFMTPDAWPYPYPGIFPETVPYIPGVTQSDQDLLDLYAQGLLQSTNPNAANYVSPEKYAEIAALAGQLQQGATPEGQVAAANDQLKKPLTQKELEESLKKEREAEDKATKESLGPQPVLSTLLDPYKQFEDGVKNTPNDQIHSLPTNSFIIGGNGQCYVITKTLNIMGQTMTISTQGVCEEFYYPYFLPILTWFFYVSTGIYVWLSMRDAFERRL
ncbi:hypothetical protein [Aeromonas caviae]|uniref:hypothetical protein n=1 Tax=Aeromonas caviae TaxID=648 RepID=UPI002B4806CA|nr:hypothetical protein [Aeromonas caviae]